MSPKSARRHSRGISLLALAALCFAPIQAQAATPDEVDQAIAKCVDFLIKQQKDGNWEPGVPEQPASIYVMDAYKKGLGGMTALATYALIEAGERPTSPELTKSIDFMMKTPTDTMYSLAERAQVWSRLPPSDAVKKMISRDGGLLLKGMKQAGVGKGLYHYYLTDEGYDHSVSQLAMLGVSSLQRRGLEVPDKFWQMADAGWRSHQFPEGSWAYRNDSREIKAGETKPEPGMTAAGVASLFLTTDALHGDGIECNGNLADKNIELGLKWMGDNFDKVFDGARAGPYYALYGVQRIGVASGRKYMGTHDWYAAGADFLVKHQNPDGSFAHLERRDIFQKYLNLPETCFALLFLANGRAPVMVNKLQYDLTDAKGARVEGPWNQRGRDLSNLTKWVGQQLERPINWQTTPLTAPTDELLDAPILYISGSKALSFTAGEKAKLRDYVESGGLILGNADCGSKPFLTSFIALGHDLFPQYEFGVLPANHAIFKQQFDATKWKTRFPVKSLSNGVRELMVIVPDVDLSRYWQANAHGERDAYFELADNLFLYANGSAPLRRTETFVVKADPAIKAEKSIKLARLDYPGNSDPEPGGWRRLKNVLHNQDKVDLTIDTIKLGEGKLGDGKLNGCKLAHLTGTETWKPNDAAKSELKAFVAGGGTLIIDAAGGSTAFYDSARTVLVDLFAEVLKEIDDPLPPDHALFGGKDKPIEIRYRRASAAVVGKELKSARIRGLKVGGRLAIFLSPDDLSAGLTGQSTDAIVGYRPDTATSLMERMVMFGQ